MKKKGLNFIKLIFGFMVSMFFLFLAFRQVKFENLVYILLEANIWIIMLAVAVNLLSHWLRSIRHYYLLKPLQEIKGVILFFALIIGYMFNSLLPAHLGEIVRAYIIGKKSKLSSSSIFASIVVERVVDILSLLLLMAIISILFPFPEVILISAYFAFGIAGSISFFIILLKIRRKNAFMIVSYIMQPLPIKWNEKVLSLLDSFINGFIGLGKIKDYCIFFVLTISIWLCYAVVLAIGLFAFNFYSTYQLPAVSAFVILIMTTIAIMIPSSPGYIGTYHWICMTALSYFNVPEDASLGYAIVMHANSVLPVTIIGLIFAIKEGLSIGFIRRQAKINAIASQV